jgi:hypothetical protein
MIFSFKMIHPLTIASIALGASFSGQGLTTVTAADSAEAQIVFDEKSVVTAEKSTITKVGRQDIKKDEGFIANQLPPTEHRFVSLNNFDCDSHPDGCDSLGCDPSRNHHWMQLDLLGWWGKGMTSPILASQAARGQAPILGETGTINLFGGDDLLDDIRIGARLRGGFWYDDCRRLGIEAEIFGLTNENDAFNAHSAGLDTLGRPFVNAANGQPIVQFIGFLPEVGTSLSGSGAVCGGLEIDAKSKFHGAGISILHQLVAPSCKQAEVLGFAGYRFLRLDDQLSIHENLISTDPLIDPNLAFHIDDQFQTETRFHGIDLGLRWRRESERMILQATMRVALGTSRQFASIRGNTAITDVLTGVTESYEGGLLAQSSNIGEYDRSRFAVVPETELMLGYRINESLTATVGYNFLYWSNVVRAGEQIDTAVNLDYLPPTQVPTSTPERPEFNFEQTGIWFQGISLGLAYGW